MTTNNDDTTPTTNSIVSMTESMSSSGESEDPAIENDSTKTRLLPGAPSDYGLLLSLDSNGTCHFTLVPDANYKQLHPNIYAPASLEGEHKVAGGGSGVTVFQGELPRNLGGSVVMKHGSHKDTSELFALATIAQQLQIRGKQCPPQVVTDMQSRIPEFKFIYMSPWHFCERHVELWDKLRNVLHAFHLSSDDDSSDDSNFGETFESFIRRHRFTGTKRHGRSIRLYKDKEQENYLDIHKDTIDILLESCQYIATDNKGKPTLQYGQASKGYDCLQPMVEELMNLQKRHFWKFTLAQKTIGGPLPKTASSLLAAGLLHGDLLQTLIDEFITVIRNLQALTLPEERSCVDAVKKELAMIQANPDWTSKCVSPLADAFCGKAIRKNFHPERGRFMRVRDVGIQFRSGSLVLEPEEEVPAHFLGILMKRDAQMNQVYADAPAQGLMQTLNIYHSWRGLLEKATSLKSKAAVERIWTCGATDAGLHNLFLSDGKLWLFDLGEPTLQPLPGFLTKFLFSFFHTLGMEENDNGGWVKRFTHEGDLLALTPETKALLPQAYQAFQVVLDQFVEKLFHGEDAIRPLLIEYMTLQLISDSAFCLEKWTIKGGGQRKVSNSHHVDNEKWLWRALWDQYVAFDINTKVWTK